MPVGIERFDPSARERMAYEHLHRYALAYDLVPSTRVLDAACGEGYGSWILSRVATQVVGLDNDADAVAAAQLKYVDEDRLSFQTGDCHDLPFPDQSFDVVVSFETIEHVTNPNRVVSEFKRVLRPGGWLLISTPNKPVYNRYKPPNIFHVEEFDETGFVDLLRGSFAHVSLFGQRLAVVSTVAPTPAREVCNSASYGAYLPVQRLGRLELQPGTASLPDPEYHIALCGDGDLPRPSEPASIFVDPTDDLWAIQERVLHWASGLSDAVEAASARNARERAELEAALHDSRRREDESRQHADRLASDLAGAQAGDFRSATGPTADVVAVASRAMADETIGRLLSRQLDRSVGSQLPDLVAALAEMSSRDAARVAELAGLHRRIARLTQMLSRLAEANDRDANEPEFLIASIWGRLKRDKDLREPLALETEQRFEERRTSGELRETVARLERGSTESAAMVSRLDHRVVSLKADIDRATQDAADRAEEARTSRDQVSRSLADFDRVRLQTQAEHAGHVDEVATLRERLNALEARVDEKSQSEQRLADEAIELRAEVSRLAGPRLPDRTSNDPARRTPVTSDAIKAQRHPSQMAMSVLSESHRHLREPTAGLLQSLDRTLIGMELKAQHRNRDGRALADARGSLSEQIGSALPHLTPLPPRRRRPFWLPNRRQALVRGYTIGELVTAGDQANRDRDWPRAEMFYAAALRGNLDLTAIWIQYGHALKEQGHLERSEVAYRQATLRSPDDADANLHLGIVSSTLAQTATARRALERAAELQPTLRPLVESLILNLPAPPGNGDWTRDLEDLRETVASLKATEGSTCHALTTSGLGQGYEAAWPPPSVNDYWLTQAMRNYIIESHGESVVGLYQYLMSVVEYYTGSPGAFFASEDAQRLLARATLIAAREDDRKPDVSIVLPVYNNAFLTLTNVISVLETAGRYTFEILVGDDQSTDETATLVSAIGGCVHHVRHTANLGFLGNCNAVALRARGRFIVMLNSDALTMPGWLDELILPLDNNATVGLSGSKLLNGDGTLQEAGGIFWQDGSAWNFGRNSDPRLPQFNYSKESDYISGASIALRTETWHAFGGFDPVFSPGYCEDSDLAFRLRAAGRTVVYAPRSEIIHHEGRSHGTDLSTGIKAFQVTNGHKLRERWHTVLERDHFPNGETVFLARDRSRRRPHVLVVDHYVPQWDQDAGSRTLYLYVKLFVENGFMVTFWPDNLHRDPEYTPALQRMGVEVIYSDSYHNKFPEWIRENGRHIDYAFLSRPHITERYIDDIKSYTRGKIIYYGHDLHFRRLRDQYAISKDPELLREAEALEITELGICNKSDVVFYPGFEEVGIVRDRVLDRVQVKAFPITVFNEDRLSATEVALRIAERPNPYHLMFIGGFAHMPNRDGITWFAREVVPRLLQRDPRFHLFVAGSSAPPEVEALESGDVTVLGRISDESLVELYARVGVAVIPLRFGGGVKGKVVEAMAHGTPVAMTSVGAQGIPNAQTLATVADDPDDLAAGIHEIVLHPGTANARAKRALDFIRSSYSDTAIRALMGTVMPELSPKPSPTVS